MKMSTKHLAFLIVELLVLIFFLWKALQSRSDNAEFYFSLGMVTICLAGVYGLVFYGPARLARLGLTIPGIYRDAKIGKGNLTPTEHILVALGFCLIVVGGYFKFFTQ